MTTEALLRSRAVSHSRILLRRYSLNRGAMAGTYDWNPMPHKVDINCPSCGELAVFEFAEVVRIKLKKDVPLCTSREN